MRTVVRVMRAVSITGLALVLAACGATPTVPDHTYYRMPRPQELPVAQAQVFELPVVVGLFAADGLYADRALVYALDAEANELRQYHYQLWTDPPTRVLQRRLQGMLRRSAIAPLVVDELAASQQAFRVNGVILRFERVPTTDGGSIAAVVIKLRIDRPDGTPLVDEFYRAEVPAEGRRLGDTVAALGLAVDRIFAEFHADLVEEQRKEAAHVR